MLSHLGAISGCLGSMFGHVGGKMLQDSDQEGSVEPAWAAWRLPDGKSQGGLMVKVGFWGPTHTQKTLRFSYCKPRNLKISILEEILLL